MNYCPICQAQVIKYEDQANFTEQQIWVCNKNKCFAMHFDHNHNGALYLRTKDWHGKITHQYVEINDQRKITLQQSFPLSAQEIKHWYHTLQRYVFLN